MYSQVRVFICVYDGVGSVQQGSGVDYNCDHMLESQQLDGELLIDYPASDLWSLQRRLPQLSWSQRSLMMSPNTADLLTLIIAVLWPCIIFLLLVRLGAINRYVLACYLIWSECMDNEDFSEMHKEQNTAYRNNLCCYIWSWSFDLSVSELS